MTKEQQRIIDQLQAAAAGNPAVADMIQSIAKKVAAGRVDLAELRAALVAVAAAGDPLNPDEVEFLRESLEEIDVMIAAHFTAGRA